MSIFDRLIRLGLPLVPRFLARRVAARYIAGPTLDDALGTIRGLASEGASATLVFLGEETRDRGAVEAVAGEYLRALDAVAAAGLESHLSLKPSQFGLGLDPELCREKVGRVVERAAELGTFVRLDMEDHTLTDRTLALHADLGHRYSNVGVVLQARLRRTLKDASLLAAEGASVRLCKGIYLEPRSLAWRDFATIRSSFTRALEILLAGGGRVAVATHDEHLVFEAMSLVDRLGVDRERYEFQMLLGVDPELRRIILEAGHRLRVYVPYGADGLAYSMRRLRENPEIAKAVLRALFRFRRSPGRR